MATLDTRLLPLIEVLTTANADWLAFEILDGLKQGRVAEETRDDLLRAQLAVRMAKGPTRMEERTMPPPAPTPILRDEQIDWAVAYVGKRLTDAVLMLQESLRQLDEIMFNGQTAEGAPSTAPPEVGITLVLQSEDQALRVRRGEVFNAIAALPKLHDALRVWAAAARNGRVTE